MESVGINFGYLLIQVAVCGGLTGLIALAVYLLFWRNKER